MVKVIKEDFDEKHICNCQLTNFHFQMVAMQPMILLQFYQTGKESRL